MPDDDAPLVAAATQQPHRRATPNGAGAASLMAWGPGAGRIQQLQVGGQFPADHLLSWAIKGVFLGPWPIPQVTDTC